MGRAIAIDYGLKRCGLAWTDPMQIIATGLETVPPETLLKKLKEIMVNEQVDVIVLGFPTRMDGTDTHLTAHVRELHEKLLKQFPQIEVILHDERFTSKMAVEAMIRGGVPKKKRQDKALVDKTSATMILQEYLESKSL